MRNRREQRISGTADIWPGYVDALSTLLLVTIFLLVVFVLGQFLLNQLLLGRDKELDDLNARIETLVSDVETSQSREDALTTALDEKELALQESAAAREELNSLLQTLRTDIDRLAIERDTLSDKFDDVMRERTQLRDEIAALSIMRDDLGQELEQIEAALFLQKDISETLQEKLTEREATLGQQQQNLRLSESSQLSQQERMRLMMQRMLAYRAEIEATQTDADRDIASLQIELTAKQAEIARYEQQLQALQQESDTTLDQLSAQQDQLARTQTERDGQAERMRRMIERMMAYRAELDDTRSTVGGEVATLRADLASQQAEIDGYIQRLTALSEERDTALAENAILREELLGLRNDSQDQVASYEARRAEQDARLEETLEQMLSMRLDFERLERLKAQLEADIVDAATTRRALQNDLALAETNESELEQALQTREQTIAQLRTLIDSLAAEKRALGQSQNVVVAREADLLRQLEALEAVIADQNRQLLEAQQVTSVADGRIAELSRQVELVMTELDDAEHLLEIERDTVAARDTRIETIETQLNDALASQVEQLRRFRSDFFGRIRELIADRDDLSAGIQIEGDRFVFPSEVLFSSGQAQLNPVGQEQLADLATSLRELIRDLPSDLPWLLRIDGHTDDRPINTARFPSNWELSAARAIAVLRFLRTQGIPPERMAATGFASFQAIDPTPTEEARRRNRRIEIKLTSR